MIGIDRILLSYLFGFMFLEVLVLDVFFIKNYLISVNFFIFFYVLLVMQLQIVIVRKIFRNYLNSIILQIEDQYFRVMKRFF